MNGLLFLCKLCNINQTFLAEKMEVSRQTIHLWQTGKRSIPEQRKEMLSELFGVCKDVFGDISHEQINKLLKAPMHKHIDGKREYYCFTEHAENLCNPGFTTNYSFLIKIGDDCILSLDERLNLKKLEFETMLDEIKNLSFSDELGVADNILTLNRSMYSFGSLVDTQREINKKPIPHKMSYHHTMYDVLSAMSMAFGCIDIPIDIEDKTLNYKPPFIDEWTIELSKLISERLKFRIDHRIISPKSQNKARSLPDNKNQFE